MKLYSVYKTRQVKYPAKNLAFQETVAPAVKIRSLTAQSLGVLV